jgi:hypothetical protein
MFLLSNANLVLSDRVNEFPDGTEFTRDGWLATGNTKWALCPDMGSWGEAQIKVHPCGGEVLATAGSFYYDTDGDTSTVESLLINEAGFPAGATARMTALMCFVDLDNPTDPCQTAPKSEDDENNASLVLTLLAYGYSDCSDTTSIATCNAEATVSLPVSSFKSLEGNPLVPLTSKSTFPPTGTAEVVGNPNAGGVGVPLTVWINANVGGLCPAPATPITSSGSWQTCELQEWYHTDEIPAGITCTDNNCFCGSGGNDTSNFLSWRKGTDTYINIDILIDPDFPCDLFYFFFGIEREHYQIIKNQSKIYADCSELGPQSSGMIWISGPLCKLNANLKVGSPGNPVILISAATSTVLAGGVEIYGVLYVFDGEDANATITTLGGATIYGAAVIDAGIDKFQGTFQIVYADQILASAAGIKGIGSVNGGWRDFGLPEIGWP